MKLTVNGVEVPIRDRLEITLEVPPEGGELDWVHGRVVGGPLKIQPPRGTLGSGGAVVELLVSHRVNIVRPPDGYGIRTKVGMDLPRDVPHLIITSLELEPPKSWRELPPQL